MIIGWQSHIGKYLHKCDECGEEFNGRKNQLYCNVKCKAKHNNDLASQRHVQVRMLTEDYLRNIEVISRILGEDNFDVEIVSRDTLAAQGFESACINKRISVDGELWYKVGPFGYRPLIESNEVELLRLDEDDTNIFS